MDPVAVAAREAREREIDERIAKIVAAEQKELDEHGEKICVNDRSCAVAIPQSAARCPNCGKAQPAIANGAMSGVRRSALRRHDITFTFGAA